jgi:lactate dehydrogenase-like 2-hydroxyacid dehydrogenase
MPPRLFVACRLPIEAQALFSDRFTARFNEYGRTLTPAELIAESAGAEALVLTATDRLDTAAIAALDPSIRIVATYSVGHEHIDLDAAHARGLALMSTPDVLSDSCADTAMLLMLGAARRVVEGLALVRDGGWTGWTPLQLLGTEVHGRRIGIVGMGRIGRAIARRARGFDMPVHYHNRRELPADQAENARYHPTLETLLAVSDFLCVACPANAETRHLIDADRIARLPDGAVVVNIGRGEVIDDRALIAALSSGKVAAAGLDVFENEPAIDPAYRTLPNVFGLPHIGSATLQTRLAMARLLADGLEAFFTGARPDNLL